MGNKWNDFSAFKLGDLVVHRYNDNMVYVITFWKNNDHIVLQSIPIDPEDTLPVPWIDIDVLHEYYELAPLEQRELWKLLNE